MKRARERRGARRRQQPGIPPCGRSACIACAAGPPPRC